jgi:hypothetical protein
MLKAEALYFFCVVDKVHQFHLESDDKLPVVRKAAFLSACKHYVVPISCCVRSMDSWEDAPSTPVFPEPFTLDPQLQTIQHTPYTMHHNSYIIYR